MGTLTVLDTSTPSGTSGDFTTLPLQHLGTADFFLTTCTGTRDADTEIEIHIPDFKYISYSVKTTLSRATITMHLVFCCVLTLLYQPFDIHISSLESLVGTPCFSFVRRSPCNPAREIRTLERSLVNCTLHGNIRQRITPIIRNNVILWVAAASKILTGRWTQRLLVP